MAEKEAREILGKAVSRKGDKRSSTTASNMGVIVKDAIAALPEAERAQCDAEKLLLFVREWADGMQCNTSEDVTNEIARKEDAIKAQIVELKIGTESFVASLNKIAEESD
mmetsp:Transcript_49183/g.128342  ORF Transcript_49183/g.128342 Transcript_49183/m.128342 type:complete len:110 (-) Transcript_49183:581-910(-)